MSEVSFLLDMGVSPLVGRFLQGVGYQVAHAKDIGLGRASDADLLEHARRSNAIVITTDKDLGNIMVSSGSALPSVITMRLDNPSAEEQVAALRSLLERLRPEDLTQCLVTLQRNRFRRRALPLG